MTLAPVKERTEAAEYHETARIYPFTRWTPDIVDWIQVRDESSEESRFFREPGYSSFEVRTLDLPLATDRWKVKWQAHTTLTFEDLRAGRLPRVSSQELTQRQEAIKAARKVRERLNINPLTTTAIIRRLRYGAEKE